MNFPLTQPSPLPLPAARGWERGPWNLPLALATSRLQSIGDTLGARKDRKRLANARGNPIFVRRRRIDRKISVSASPPRPVSSRRRAPNTQHDTFRIGARHRVHGKPSKFEFKQQSTSASFLPFFDPGRTFDQQ